MRIIKTVVILMVIMLKFSVNAQPYIYFPKTVTGENYLYDKIQRYNLRTNDIENFPPQFYIATNSWAVWDPSQSYLAINYDNSGYVIFDCNDTTKHFELTPNLDESEINELLYSPVRNKLYIFSENYSSDFPNSLSVFDLANGQIISNLGVTTYVGENDLMHPKRNAFFSADGNKIYFFCKDTLTAKEQVWTYSLDNNEIILKRNLSEFGFSGLDGFELTFGRNGNGIIQSYSNFNNPHKDFYFNIFNFDADSGSTFIYRNNLSEGYFIENGERMVILETSKDDSLRYSHNGFCQIYNTKTAQLLKTLNFPPGGIVYTFDNYPNDFYYVKDIELPTRQIVTLKMDSIFNELNLSNLTPSTATLNSPVFTLTVKGRGFDSSSTVYFNGQTKTTTFVSDSLLTAQIFSSDISVAGNFPVWVTDQWAVSDTLQFTVTQSSFPNLIVSLKNSQGALLTTGSLQYYEGSWKDAVNNGDGTFTVITNLNTVSLRMAYEYGSQTVANVTAHNNTFTFQTVNAAVQLKNSLGNFIDAGTVQYYSGAWRNFGTTTNGVANKELLPINYSFRMAYEFASIDKQQNLSVNPTVVFQTVNAAVQLKNSLGNLIDAGTVKYYSGAWRNFGTTANGVANKELLPINYSFRMAYEFASIDKQQNLSVDPTVVFQTVNAAVQLKNSLGNLIDAGTVQYYSGAWRTFGTTTNGVATKELLPINYSFRMAYEYASVDKQQNLSVDPTVVFQTVNAAVQLKNSSGNLIDAGTVQYYSGAWRNFGITTNGVATKELLPINYSFRMTYEYVSNDKQQNLSTNPVVNFATVLCSVKVSNATNQPLNNANVKYYSGAWRNLGITNAEGITIKELLPANLSFRASLGNVSKDKQQDITSNYLVEINLNTP